jgi:TonB-linked SusC/RagA family outer membrane protein
MKRIVLMFSMILLALAVQDAAAQTRRITGRVTSAETGQGLPSVQVLVTGTSVGTLTDNNGAYVLENVPASAATLTFSSLGYATRQAPISGDVVNVALTTQAVALEGVVVTALGQEQQKRAIGTAVQEVQGEQLTQARETNIVNALSGKVSGVQITNAGPQGGSSRIVIRGANSITGNNQPLFIIDGIPIDNTPSSLAFRGYGGVDYGNAAQDINPNDIAAITVLKGPNAAALYGSRAANGAIVITTKKGRAGQGLGITASVNQSFETPLRLPQYQNQYGQGYGGEFAYVNGAGAGLNDDADASWGPKLDAGLMIPQFNSPVVNGVRQPTPWVSNPDNVRGFFETGRTLNTNVAVSTASENANVRLSLSNMRQDGMYPGFQLDRTTVSLAGGADLTERLNANASVQYVNSDGKNRPGTGYDGDNPMLQFVWFGRQVDVSQLKQRRNADGSMYNWNHNYHSNPYWIALENANFDARDRVIGSGSVSYQLTDWLTGTVRGGTDWYRDWRKRTYADGTIGIAPGLNGEGIGANGAFGEDQFFRQETNLDFLLSAQRELTNAFSLSGSFGGNRRTNDYKSSRVYVEDLSAPGIYSVSNFAITPVMADRTEEKQVNSLYGQAQLGYNNYLFVDVTGRNDWSSTLPAEHNSYFYPSVSTSFIFTDAIPALGSGILSYGKLRAGWAQVGNDASPYQTMSTYSPSLPFRGMPRVAVQNLIPNPNLKPETTTSIELGTELSFFGGRLDLDATYYDAQTTDQIIRVDISPTSGYTQKLLNAGTLKNRGVELMATAIPVRLDNGFEWEMTANFAKNKSTVADLPEGIDAITLGTYWSLRVEAREGDPYGALYGFPYRRVDDESSPYHGQKIISASSGAPLRGTSLEVLGNYNPDWTGSLSNTLRYKNVDFSFLLDTKQGGKIFSVTEMFGRYAGILEETVPGRCNWPDKAGNVPNNGLQPCGPSTGLVIPGVKLVDGKYVENDVVISAEDYWSLLYGTHEAHLVDASYVKLRELRLGYTLPNSMTRRLGIHGANVSLVGRNLWLNTKGKHIDPETAFDASNVQGIEFGQLPSARSIGINFVVTP